MDIIDRTPNILSEIRSQYQRTRWRIRVLDRRDLFIKLINDDMRVQIGEVIDLGYGCAQHLLDADKVGSDQVDLIRADATNLTGRCVIKEVCGCKRAACSGTSIAGDWRLARCRC